LTPAQTQTAAARDFSQIFVTLHKVLFYKHNNKWVIKCQVAVMPGQSCDPEHSLGIRMNIYRFDMG